MVYFSMFFTAKMRHDFSDNLIYIYITMKDLYFEENYFKRQCSTVVEQTHSLPKCGILTMFVELLRTSLCLFPHQGYKKN